MNYEGGGADNYLVFQQLNHAVQNQLFSSVSITARWISVTGIEKVCLTLLHMTGTVNGKQLLYHCAMISPIIIHKISANSIYIAMQYTLSNKELLV